MSGADFHLYVVIFIRNNQMTNVQTQCLLDLTSIKDNFRIDNTIYIMKHVTAVEKKM